MRTALVTGGAGFIGSHVVELLLAEGWSVRVLDDFSSGSLDNLPAPDYTAAHRLQVLEGDIRDQAMCRRACAGADAVFHLAAIASVARSVAEPEVTQAVNIAGTLNMLAAARDCGARRFVFSSSAAVYGNADACPTDEGQPLRPASPYAVEKAAGEFYCRNFLDLFGLETAVLRYFNVFGPRQSANSGYAAVVPCFIQAALNGEQPTVYGDGLQTRDFVFVENVARANLLAATAPGAAGRTFNIGSGEAVSLLDLIDALEAACGRRLEPRFAAARPGEVRHSRANITHARRILGYSPRVAYADGLRRTLDAARPRGARRLSAAVPVPAA